MVGEAKRKDTLLKQPLRKYAGTEISWDEPAKAEAAVLVDEVMATCDKVTLEFAFRRLDGLSRKEIGEQFGRSVHAVELRFKKSLEHARKTLGKRQRKGGGEFSSLPATQ